MRIGVMSSSGGAVLEQCIAACAGQHQFFLVTDRACGSEALARKHGVPVERCDCHTNDDISRAAQYWFQAQGDVDFILLFYLRIVSRALTSSIPTFNIHPSLLPAYSGFHAVDRALKDRSRFLGATLHLATEAVDGGPILAQACAPIEPTIMKADAAKLSFLQKCYLAIWLIDAMERGCVSADARAGTIAFNHEKSVTARHFNPALPAGPYLDYLKNLFASEGYPDLLVGV
jgi:phosphoribosylglycinamide formyltransferase 1